MTRTKTPIHVLALSLALVSCGDEGGSVWQAMESGEGDAAEDADDGVSATGATGGTAGTADGTAGGTGESTTATSAVDDTGGSTGFIFDVGGDTGDIGACGCDLNYIWIANAEQGTVSKIDTATITEIGRYITRPDGAGDPSRTSVSLSGDVAVANRAGGLTKFYAEESDCADTNGMPGIQTSSGAMDILSWEMEECRAWYTEFPTSNQRPVAWTQGSALPDGCDSEGEKLWTVASAELGLGPGIGGLGGVNVYLVDGETGAIENEILVETFSGFQLGAYGGAVDGAGDLWFSPMGGVDLGANPLTRVDVETFEVTHFDIPKGVATYGITVDHNGRVWMSSTLGSGAARFDPVTEVWDVLGGFGALGGLAEDANNHMWVSTNAGAVSYDIDTLTPGNVFVAPNGGGVKGIGVDADGYVWAVNDVAWKIDPDTGLDVGSYNGLTGPYTYSDMTGWALANATCPPEG